MTPEDEDKAIKNLREALERGREIERAIEATNEEVLAHGGTLPDLSPEEIEALTDGVLDRFNEDMEEERREQESTEKEKL